MAGHFQRKELQQSNICPGDIILEINGQDVLDFTTKEVLNCLRLARKEVLLKLKTDNGLKEKVNHLKQTPNNSEILRTAITQDDLQGVKQILAKKEEQKKEVSNKESHDSSSPLQTKAESPKESTSSFSSDSSLSNLENSANENEFLQPEKHHKSEANFVISDLTLDLPRASHHPNPLSAQVAVHNAKKSSTSMPTSPNESERGQDVTEKNDQHDLGSSHSLRSPLSVKNEACGAFTYPPSSPLVRISKSEDYLQHEKDNMSSVNIDLDDDVTSSLNTLLDTRDDSPACSSIVAINMFSLNNHNNNKDDPMCILNAPFTSSSPPDSSGHSSHDSDSPLIHSLSPVSPQSPTSSMQYSCSAVYNKMCSARDSLGSSNRSDGVCSNHSSGSSLTSPDTDVPDELEWDDTTPTFSPTNQMINGYNDKSELTGQLAMNGHLNRTRCTSPSDSAITDTGNFLQKLDDHRIVIKVAGPEKAKKKKHSSHPKRSSHEKGYSLNGDPDRTPTNTPPVTPGSGTLSPETLAYQQLWESEDEITCLSEKSDESSSTSTATKPTSQRTPCATSPPMSEDESDIESLHSFHYSPKAVDIPSAVRLAKRLFALDGFKKSDVSRHLSKNNEFSKAVAEEYLHYFNFQGDTLDIALRKFLDKFCLSGETQERERVLVHFSKHYLDCNPGTFNSQDAVHTLTCALMLLNTDLHGQTIGRKMTCMEFIANLAELNDGENFNSSILKSLYEAIRVEPLKWATDEEEESKNVKVVEEGQRIVGGNPFLSAPGGSGVIYKKGYIMRKCCVEPNGKRTAFGKRSWKMWFCVIQDLILYLHKDEQGAKRGPLPQMGQNAVRLHHALAQKAYDYAKKEHVFRLQTADQAEYLLQTSDSKELQAWIDAINFVAASLSAPPMPGAVGSQRKFQRPLLPCSITKFNVMDQLEDHTARLRQIENDLDHLKSHPPDKTAKSATVSSHKEKEIYLTAEVKRYQVYVHVLQSRLEAVAGASQAGSAAAVCGIGLNELPVFDAATTSADSVQVKEVSPDEGGVLAAVVPPPIPDRPRHADSDETSKATEDFGDIEIMEKEEVNEVEDSKTKRRNSKKKEEFQKELDKMIKEKEKSDKKREKKEKKSQVIEDSNNGDVQIKKRRGSTASDDPRMGTLNRLTAIFKFSKLNRRRRSCTSYDVQQMELMSKNQKTSSKKGDGDAEIGSFPMDKPEKETRSPTPPPLPPKPSFNSPVRQSLGTRVINV